MSAVGPKRIQVSFQLPIAEASSDFALNDESLGRLSIYYEIRRAFWASQLCPDSDGWVINLWGHLSNKLFQRRTIATEIEGCCLG
jgi:hypothetical protein